MATDKPRGWRRGVETNGSEKGEETGGVGMLETEAQEA